MRVAQREGRDQLIGRDCARSAKSATRKRFGDLAPQDWRHLAIAVKELLIARIRYALQPAGKILLDLHEAPQVYLKGGNVRVDLARMAWSIDAAAARVPWRSDCLLRVMAADRWLRRWRLPREFFLGAGHDDNGHFCAHAWLLSDGVEITGGSGAGFVPLIEPRERT